MTTSSKNNIQKAARGNVSVRMLVNLRFDSDSRPSGAKHDLYSGRRFLTLGDPDLKRARRARGVQELKAPQTPSIKQTMLIAYT